MGNIFSLQGKQFLQEKLRGKNASTSGKASVCTFLKFVSSTSKYIPLIQPSMVSIAGKIVFQVKIWVSTSEKHVSASAEKTFIDKKFEFPLVARYFY